MNLSGLWLNICGRVHGAEAAAAAADADDSGRCPGCRIGGVLRGDSLFSADGAAGIVWGWWLTGWLIGGASPRCVCAWGCLLLESCVRRWCALLVGKLILLQLPPTLGWAGRGSCVVAVGSWLACEGTLCVGRTEPQRKSGRFFSAN